MQRAKVWFSLLTMEMRMLTWAPPPLKSTWHMVKVSRNFSCYYQYHPRAPKHTPPSCAWDSDCIPALTNQCLLCQASRSRRSREFNALLFLYLKWLIGGNLDVWCMEGTQSAPKCKHHLLGILNISHNA